MAIKFDNIEAESLLNRQGELTITLTDDQGIIVPGIVGLGSTGVYAGTNAALNLPGKGIALKNDKDGSNNNWSYINNTATSGQSNINFATGQASAALTLAHSGNATFSGTITTPNLYLGSASVRLSPGTNGEVGINYNTSATGSLVWYAGGTASKFNVTNAGNATFAGTISASNFSGSSSGTNTGDQVLPTLSSLGGASSGYLTNTSGAKLEIQNGVDGGGGYGIYMWTSTDTNWGIYMAQAGDGKALNDGTASAGIDEATAHAIRFRVNDNSSQAGFIWENSSNETLMQLNGGSEKLYTRNAIYPSNQTTNYVDSTRIENWQTAYGWGDHGSQGYLTTVAFSDLTSKPSTLSGYGITDAVSLGTDNVFTGDNEFEGDLLRTNQRIGSNQEYPLGHYTPGETVFELNSTWSNRELRQYFGNDSVSWDEVANAPGGYAVYINGSVSVGGAYGSGFPYIPIDQDGIYYMECWIKNAGTGQGHYMGSMDYESDFTHPSSGGGNPGSYGYFVMSNYTGASDWTKVSGYITGHHNSNTGAFETDATYWTPQALFNYSAGTGTRACWISGWKVIRVDHVGDRTFQDDVKVKGKLEVHTLDTNTASTTALVMNGNEVEKRTLGSNAFNSTSFLTSVDFTDIGGTVSSTGGATRTNYNLGFRPAASSYAGFRFYGADGNNAGYFLVRGTSDNGVYAANGITLVGDQGWLTLAHRYSSDKGIRFMTGNTSAPVRMSIASDGDVSINNSLTVGADLGVSGFIKDELYKHSGNTNWRTKKYVRSVGITGGDINNSWVQLSRVTIGSSYEKVTIKFTINGYDDVSSGVEAIDVRYENGNSAQENHQMAWYSTDDHANLFKNVRSIRSSSSGLSNTYDLYVQMAGDWRDNFTVVAESWTTHAGDSPITYITAAGSANEPSAGSNDIERTERRWYTENTYMYLGSGRVYTTSDFSTSDFTYSAGTLLDLSSNTFNVDLTELTNNTAAFSPTQDHFVILDNGVQGKKLASSIFGSAAYEASSAFATASHTHGGVYVPEYEALQPSGSDREMNVWRKTHAVYSDNGGASTYFIIQTEVPQDNASMGGFTLVYQDDYSSSGEGGEIKIYGYWNAESNGGFTGFRYECSNPYHTPTIEVCRNSSSGKTAFFISGEGGNYTQLIAKDLWLGYVASSATQQWGNGWVISQADNKDGYANFDTLNRNDFPAITTDGSTPSLTGGVDAAEVRTLIGAPSTSVATTSANGLMSSTDKTKLDGIETSADVTDATNVAAAGALMTSGGTISGDLTVNGKLAISGVVDREEWGRSYTVSNTNIQNLLDSAGTEIANGGAYRVVGHIDGTGTDQASSAVFWNQNGTWYVNVTGQSGTSSNHIQFLVNGGKPAVKTYHGNNYTVRVSHERLALEETGTDNARYYFGADSYMSDIAGTLKFQGTHNIWHAGNSEAFTTADHTKLDGIASGAEVNVQADWNETTTTSDAYINNKPTLGTAAASAATDFISATNADTAAELITFSKGISTDGHSKFYNWRALNNSSNSGNSYWKIAEISGADQSSRFIVTLAGRSTSYSDNSLPAMGHIVGQLNNDNNWDLVFYNHSTASSEVVTEVAIVDDGTLGVELWIKTGNYAEITASGHISDGSFTVVSNVASDGFTESPDGYTVITEYTVMNTGNSDVLYKSGGTMSGDILLGTNSIAADTTSPTAHIQVGAGTSNTTNRSDVALLGEASSGGVVNALGLVNTASGTNSNGVALNFHNGNSWSPTGQIIVQQDATGTATNSAMKFYTFSGGLNHRMSIKSDGTIRFNAYGAGLIASDSSGNLSVDTSTYLTGIAASSVGITELKVSDGSAGQALTTDGDGNLAFATISGGSTYTLPAATSSALGGVKLGYTANAKNYPVQLDASNKAYVNVPWANTNTTYSAGSGLDLSSTTFSVEADLRDGITHVGVSANNYITFDNTNNRIDFYAGGAHVARMESDGDLHIKGDVIAFSSLFA